MPFLGMLASRQLLFATLSVSMSTKIFFRRSTPALEVLSSSALLVSLLALTTGLPGPCPSFRWAMQSSRPLLVWSLVLFCDNVLSPPALSQYPQGCLPPSSLGLGLISVRTRTVPQPRDEADCRLAHHFGGPVLARRPLLELCTLIAWMR
jgi:hypothetical protein